MSTNLSISLFTPVWLDNLVVRDDLATVLSDYSHTIGAVGGYLSADVKIAVSLNEGLRWLRDYIGYHLEVYDHAGVLIFEGFIDELELEVGGVSATVGPLMDVVNTATLKYQTISYNTNPPIGGNPTDTGEVQNDASVTLYGEMKALLSGGEMLSAEATQAVTRYVTEFGFPKRDIPQITLSDQETDMDFMLNVSLLGYYHLFEKQIPEDTTAGQISLDQKLTNIIDANALFYYTADSLEENTTLTGQAMNGEENAWDIIKSIMERSDDTFQRYLFQVLDGRVCHYFAVPQQIDYLYSLADPEQAVKTTQEVILYKWNVKAGRWIMVLDFLGGELPTSDIEGDPRNMFIESVTYQMPWHLAMAGGRVSLTEQMFSRFGLGGV
ncbi:hypothetical protein PZC41_14140 [Staphylococcus aureus]|uniref:hypothetical protein n=1 Tax=Staphylococcus aureus TaxID=1280 RepID=UPI0023AF8842|nr:hypothetical protein [Staphylococcus aureus]MDE8535445.1 hypothetical protein [Staphylococcus aureus]